MKKVHSKIQGFVQLVMFNILQMFSIGLVQWGYKLTRLEADFVVLEYIMNN